MFKSRRAALGAAALAIGIYIAGIAGGGWLGANGYLWPVHSSQTNRPAAASRANNAQPAQSSPALKPGYGVLPPRARFVSTDPRCHANMVWYVEFINENTSGQIFNLRAATTSSMVVHRTADGVGRRGPVSPLVRHGISLSKARLLTWNQVGSGELTNVVVTVNLGNGTAWKYSAPPGVNHVTIPRRDWVVAEIRLTATASNKVEPRGLQPLPYAVPGCHGSKP